MVFHNIPHSFNKKSCINLRFILPALIGAQTSVIQEVQYYEWLSEPMAEFLHILSSQYDHTQLAEKILMYAIFNAFFLKKKKIVK